MFFKNGYFYYYEWLSNIFLFTVQGLQKQIIFKKIKISLFIKEAAQTKGNFRWILI